MYSDSQKWEEAKEKNLPKQKDNNPSKQDNNEVKHRYSLEDLESLSEEGYSKRRYTFEESSLDEGHPIEKDFLNEGNTDQETLLSNE